MVHMYAYAIHCRGLLADIPSTAKLQLDEGAGSVCMLISGMYDANMDVSWGTVEPLLELARKYAVEDIQQNCERFLHAEDLTASSLPRHMELACKFGMDPTIKRCHVFVSGTGNLKNVMK
jgi:BTB/POZ domain